MAACQVTLPEGVDVAGSWGLGWFREDWNGRTVIGHDGSAIGQGACLRLVPELGLSVCLLTNGGPVRDLYAALFREIFHELAGIEMPRPQELPVDAPAPDGAAVAGTYSTAAMSWRSSRRTAGRGCG
ncbi:serine hydrolase [Streptomyces sp. NPDC051018]|uniref:serine hydrolase n=1 Tax=Streptomyces sp. NPDC051018 TaxID=3365639 RepID=UPI003791F1DA